MNRLLLKDIYPHKAFYKKNENIVIHIEADNQNEACVNEQLSVSIYRHQKIIREEKRVESFNHGINCLTMKFSSPDSELQGYGVEVTLGESSMSTAFDVLSHWYERPRYGFLSDFYKEDEEDTKDISSMLKYHINIVQFYDWMYKHESLISKNNYYTDLLERELSKKAVSSKIDSCRRSGMKTLAYGAIYAASKPFYETHKEWALYTNDQRPQNLGNWFYIMNISKDSPWRNHIICEFKKAITEMDFDGIHMDTYGFPKIAYSNLDGQRKLERLNEQFEGFVYDTRTELQKVVQNPCITFNSVSNWGIEEIAKSVQDAVYIEVWAPQETYYHLYQLVSRAKELSHKQVILAAYFKAFADKENFTYEESHIGLLLTSATIFASGGFHFVLGEEDCVLANPYYVKHENLKESSIREIRAYYDFIVRYGNLLFELESVDNSMTHTDGENTEYIFGCENVEFSAYPKVNTVWTLVKEQPGYKTIQLINYNRIGSDVWNAGKKRRPETVNKIKVQALVDEEVLGVYVASPDTSNGHSYELDYSMVVTDRGMAIEFAVESLQIWDLIYIEVNE